MKNKTKCSTVSRKADQEYCEDNYHIKVKAMGHNPNSLISKDSLLMRFTRWLRTKLTLVLILSVSLVSQAQISYCDSLSYTTTSTMSYPLIVTGDAGSIINIADSITWSWSVCNSSMCYTGSGTIASFGQVLTTDTLKVCYDAYIYFMGATYICTDCDSLVYDPNLYQWLPLQQLPLAIAELASERNNDGLIYDLLGRELLEIPVGTMYIINRKKYIRIR